MELLLERVVAVGALPVRRGSQLISFATPLHPDAGVGLYAAAQMGTVVFRVQGRAAAGGGQQCVLQGYLAENPEPVFASAGFALTAAWEVPVALLVAPQGFIHLVEAVRWALVTAGEGEPLATATTPLELCFVPAAPAGAERSIPYEALLETQDALTAAGLAGSGAAVEAGRLVRANYRDDRDDVAAITQWVFDRNPPAYDTLDGSPHFVVMFGKPPACFDNITLDYDRYLNAKYKADAVCNCYDLAAVVQYNVQFSTGLTVSYAYMSPFGYLLQTDLVGRGQCNNPFYDAPDRNPEKVCGRQETDRSYFGNHAFAYLPGYDAVADACAGPHLGSENRTTYLKKAQDPVNAGKCPKGTVSNITYHKGVTNVTFILPPPNQHIPLGEAYDNGFAEAVGFASAALPAEDSVQVAALPPLQTCPLLGPDWQVLADDIAPGYPLVRRRVTLGCSEGGLSCDIWVASDGCHSAQRLDLGAHTSLATTAFSRGPATLGDLAGQVLGRTSHRYLWLWHNFVFDLRADGPATAVALDVAEWLQATLQATAVPLTTQHLPQLVGASVSPAAVRVGEEVVLQARCPPEYTLAVGGEHPGLYSAEEQAGLFRYRAAWPSENRLLLYAVNEQTLLASQQEFVVKVSD